MDSIDAIVIEIEAADVRAARHALDGQDFVKSVAQLGTRLHALLAPDLADPEARVRSLLQQRGVQATVEHVRASLEDVFVAATGFGSDDEPAPLRAAQGGA
jgi:ABC-2 type transport system ATP-binding protein